MRVSLLPQTVRILPWLFAGKSLLAATSPEAPDYNREVRPILARYCFKCHGPDDKSRTRRSPPRYSRRSNQSRQIRRKSSGAGQNRGKRTHSPNYHLGCRRTHAAAVYQNRNHSRAQRHTQTLDKSWSPTRRTGRFCLPRKRRFPTWYPTKTARHPPEPLIQSTRLCRHICRTRDCTSPQGRPLHAPAPRQF